MDEHEFRDFMQQLLHRPEHAARIQEIFQAAAASGVMANQQGISREQQEQVGIVFSNVVCTMYVIGLNVGDMTEECRTRLAGYEGEATAYLGDELHQGDPSQTVQKLKDVTNGKLEQYFGRTA